MGLLLERYRLQFAGLGLVSGAATRLVRATHPSENECLAGSVQPSALVPGSARRQYPMDYPGPTRRRVVRHRPGELVFKKLQHARGMGFGQSGCFSTRAGALAAPLAEPGRRDGRRQPVCRVWV